MKCEHGCRGECKQCTDYADKNLPKREDLIEYKPAPECEHIAEPCVEGDTDHDHCKKCGEPMDKPAPTLWEEVPPERYIDSDSVDWIKQRLGEKLEELSKHESYVGAPQDVLAELKKWLGIGVEPERVVEDCHPPCQKDKWPRSYGEQEDNSYPQ